MKQKTFLLINLALPQSWSGDIVGGELAVEVEENARVGGSVEGGRRRARRHGRARASNLDVDALGIGLSSVGVARRVQGNDLVPQDVLAGADAGGDFDSPRVAVGDELISSPSSGVRSGNMTRLRNLSERETALVDRATVAVAGGKIVDDGAFVRFRPGIPLKGDGTTGCYDSMVTGWSSRLVADDVGAVEGVGFDETVVLVGSSPANGISRGTVRNAAAV